MTLRAPTACSQTRCQLWPSSWLITRPKLVVSTRSCGRSTGANSPLESGKARSAAARAATRHTAAARPTRTRRKADFGSTTNADDSPVGTLVETDAAATLRRAGAGGATDQALAADGHVYRRVGHVYRRVGHVD